MQDQLTAAGKAEWRQLRAYAYMSEQPLLFKVGQPVTAKVKIGVVGQTPAINIIIQHYTGAYQGKPPTVEEMPSQNNVGKITARRSYISSIDPMESSIPTWTLTADDVEKFKSATGFKLYHLGRVGYEDVFGCQHSIKFCFCFRLWTRLSRATQYAPE